MFCALAASVRLGLAILAAGALVRFLFEQTFHWPVGDLAVGRATAPG